VHGVHPSDPRVQRWVGPRKTFRERGPNGGPIGGGNVTASTFQDLVPVAAPLSPRSLVHATRVTPTSFEAVPRSVRDEVVVLSSGLAVGLVMMAVGAVACC
jgi:hypothetical protein